MQPLHFCECELWEFGGAAEPREKSPARALVAAAAIRAEERGTVAAADRPSTSEGQCA